MTIPVAPAVPIPCLKIRLFEEIPIGYDPTKLEGINDIEAGRDRG